jgi:hypothetical protein
MASGGILAVFFDSQSPTIAFLCMVVNIFHFEAFVVQYISGLREPRVKAERTM